MLHYDELSLTFALLYKMTGKTKAHIAVLAANLLFGINYSAVKYITPSVILPFALNALRVAFSLILFWILYILKPSKAGIDKKDIPLFLFCAATGVAINQLLFVKGLSLTTSIHGALLSLITPIFIILIAAWLLKESLTWIKICGLLLGIAGATLLIILKGSTHTGSDVLLGDTLIVINAISYAFYLVLVRPLMERYTPVHVIRWVFTFGTFMILPFGWHQVMHTDWTAFHTLDWTALIFIIVGATFIAYLFNMYGIKEIGASATGSYIYTQPVFAALVAIMFMGEQFDIYKAISAVLIFAGVFLVNYRKRTGFMSPS